MHTSESMSRLLTLLARGDLFGGRHHAANVAAHDLMDLVLRVTAIKQGLRNARIGGDIFQLTRQLAHAVKVGP